MEQSVAISEKDRLLFIDGLRGAAVLWVVFHHAFYFSLLPFLENILQGALGRSIFIVVMNGFWSVHLFFVVSGFLITGLLMDFMEGKLDIGRFYIRRCFKIIPHYYFVLGLVFILLVIRNLTLVGQIARDFFPHLFFLQNYIAGISEWFDHTWSLVAEEQFYIFWSFFLFLISKTVRAKEDRWRIAMLGAMLVVILTTINRFILYRYGISLVYLSPMTTHITHATSVVVDGLMLGCILRLLWSRYPELFRNKRSAYLLYALGVLSLVFLLRLPLNGWGVPGFWYSADFAWLFSVCFIAAGLGGVAWIFQNSWLRWIGRSSYGIYLVHYPIILILQSKFPQGGYFLLATCVLLAIGIGSVTTVTLERYFLNMRQRIAP